MKDFNQLPVELKDHIQAWMFVLLMRMAGVNIYNDDSKGWAILDCKTKEDIDAYFLQVLELYRTDNRESARSLKKIIRGIEIKSR